MSGYPKPDIDLRMRDQDYDTNALSGVELIADWNCASATWGDWTSLNTPTLTKIVDADSEGGRIGRVAYLATDQPGIRQLVLASNGGYFYRLRVRGDGVKGGRIYANAVQIGFWTSSTDWQYIAIGPVVSTGTAVDLNLDPGGTGYFEFDFLSVQKQSAKTRDSAGHNHGILGNGNQEATWPPLTPNKGLSYDGSTQYVQIPDPITSASESAFSFTIQVSGSAASVPHVWDIQNASNFHSALLYVTDRWRFYADPSTFAQFITPDDGNDHVISGTWDGTTARIYFDSVEGTSNTPSTGPTFDNQDIFLGRRYNGANDYYGNTGDFKFWDGTTLTPLEIENVYRDVSREYQLLKSYPAPFLYLPTRIDDYDQDVYGTEQVVDWDMSAVGVSDWTAVNSATLTKEDNGEGGQCLRIAYNGVSNPACSQAVGQYQQVYKFRLRGDGSTAAAFLAAGFTLARTDPLSTDWEEFEIRRYNGSPLIQVRALTVSTGYVECDYLSAKLNTTQTLDTAGTNHADVNRSQLTVGLFAAQQNDIGFNNFGSLRYLQVPSIDMTGISAHTFSIMVRGDAVAATQYLGDLKRSDGSNVYMQCIRLSTGAFRYYTGGTSSLNAANVSHPINAGDWVHVVGQYDGTNTKVFANGLAGTNAVTPLAPVITTSQNLTIGTSYSGGQAWGGSIVAPMLFDAVLTQAEIIELGKDMKRLVSRYYI